MFWPFASHVHGLQFETVFVVWPKRAKPGHVGPKAVQGEEVHASGPSTQDAWLVAQRLTNSGQNERKGEAMHGARCSYI